jgi:hypothetical protein
MARDIKPLPPRQKLRFKGIISAIHRQLIGNASGRREERAVIGQKTCQESPGTIAKDMTRLAIVDIRPCRPITNARVDLMLPFLSRFKLN